jgi:hypothetical protein
MSASANPASVQMATADHQDAIVSDDPVDNTPDVLNGSVNAILQVGDTVYVGGRFSSVQERGSAVAVEQVNLFAFSASTGKLDLRFRAVPTGGSVSDLVLAPDGRSLYVAGSFRKINDASKTSKIARISLDTGAVVPTFRSPRPDGRVSDLNLVGGTLYIGGTFLNLGGAQQNLIAALDAQTGANLGTVDFTFSDTFDGGELGIRGMDVTPDGSQMVVIGNFRNVDGQSRVQVARFNLTTNGSATLSTWSTPRFTFLSAASEDNTYMRDVAFSPDGSYFVIVTTGGYALRPGVVLTDAASRWETDYEGPLAYATWVNYTGGDTLSRVAITSSAVYIGGHMRWVNNPYGVDNAGPGAVQRLGLAALRASDGQPYSWNPTRSRGYGVYEFTVTDGGLWMGHDTKLVHKENRNRLAFFPLAGGASPPA